MCVSSMIMDHYQDKWTNPLNPLFPLAPSPIPPVSKEDFDALKRDVEEMKALLKRAVDYDKRNNEPECEMAEKVALVRKVAEMVGVTLDDVLGKASPAA